MKNYERTRKAYTLKSEIHNFLKKYKNTIILLGIFLVIGFITGIFTSSKYSGSLELDNLPDKNLIDFISGDKGSFGLFFTYFLKYFLLFILIIFFTVNKFFIILNYIIMGVLGYVLGFTISTIIILFSFAGILNVILLLLPFDLITLFLIMIVCALAINKSKICSKFGKVEYGYNYNYFYITLIILITLVIFVKSMLMPIIRITIIVN